MSGRSKRDLRRHLWRWDRYANHCWEVGGWQCQNALSIYTREGQAGRARGRDSLRLPTVLKEDSGWNKAVHAVWETHRKPRRALRTQAK